MRPGLRLSVAAAFRGVTAAPMPAGSGLAPLADISDRERRDGPPQLVIRRKHPVIAMPMLPRRRDEIDEPVEELKRRELDDAVGSRPRGLPPATPPDPATAERQVDDLAAELSDRFGPLPDEARRLLDFARLRCRAIDLGIDSITRHPGMIMIGHHDRERIDALRRAAAKKSRVVRIVDQKTAVVPLHADTLADPNKLLASVRSLVELG